MQKRRAVTLNVHQKQWVALTDKLDKQTDQVNTADTVQEQQTCDKQSLFEVYTEKLIKMGGFFQSKTILFLHSTLHIIHSN